MIRLSLRNRSYVYLLINVITWGAALPLVKLALPHTTPFRYLLYRYILASIFSLPLLYHYLRTKKKLTKTLPTIIGHELLGTTLALGLLYLGLSLTTSVESGLIVTTMPVFITIGGILFLREKEEKHEWVGLGLALLGTAVLSITSSFSELSSSSPLQGFGALLLLGQNIATAAYFLLAKRAYHGIPKLFVTSISFFVGLVSFVFLALLESQGIPLLLWQQIVTDLSHWSVWLASLYMATFGSIIGLTAYIKGQDGIEASEAGMFGYLQPLVYVPLSFLLLGEKTTWVQVAAIFIVFLGVCVSEHRNSHTHSKLK